MATGVVPVFFDLSGPHCKTTAVLATRLVSSKEKLEMRIKSTKKNWINNVSFGNSYDSQYTDILVVNKYTCESGHF
jgi:hypothetical protein